MESQSQPPSKGIGCALLGAGLFAQNAHLPALASLEGLWDLKAVYSRSQSSAEKLATAARSHPSTANLEVYYDSPSSDSSSSSSTSLEALLARKDISTVILSLPIVFQPSIIEKAWKAGKNVISEKPIAKDLKEARRLIRLYEECYEGRGVEWFVAEQFPYEPSFCKAQELIAEGRIGEIRSFRLDFSAFVERGSKYYETPWRKIPNYQGGFLLDGGVHQFSGLRHMLSPTHKLTSISSLASLLQPHLAPHDTLHGVLETSNPGCSGTFSITFGIESNTIRKYQFWGSQGTLSIDFSSTLHVLTLTSLPPSSSSSSSNTTTTSSSITIIEHPSSGVKREMESFGQALEQGRESEIWRIVQGKSGRWATLADLECVEAALESEGGKKELGEGRET